MDGNMLQNFVKFVSVSQNKKNVTQNKKTVTSSNENSDKKL